MKLTKYSRDVFRGKGGLSRFLADLDSDMGEVHRRIDLALRQKSFIDVVKVKIVGTKVHHNLGRIPTSVRATPQSLSAVYEVPGTRTTTTVTLKASVDCDAEVEVRG